MGKRCNVCKKKCTGDILKADGDKYFHIACFKCKKCQRPLSETGFYPTPEDGGYVCPEDYRALTKALKVKPPELKPIAELGGQSSATNGKGHISPPLGSPTVCAACEQSLQAGQVLLALGQQWHVYCFKCVECQQVLHGEYMAHQGKPLCLRDYHEKYGVRCHECNKFIAGKVLQAGGYKFHPTCARCSRCGEHFGDGEEMCMQGDEIWHPPCEHARTTENLATSKGSTVRSSAEPKYQSTFGQHLTYMYLLPEAEQTYLKHPISPHPPPPAQFHTPQGPIKIRKSRLSMLKTGMQRLTEDLEKNIPRPKSPHMDNEEPIEMAHYPAGHAPAPDEIPPIEKDDFPAPPYPYAVEELKRRLSSSSIENDVDDDDLEDGEPEDEEKIRRTVEELEKYDKDSSIAHVIKQNIEESHKKQRFLDVKMPLHWDPRNASRTPSAKKLPHLRFRYDTPINASPSRHLNRPRPWVFWQGAGGGDRSGTTTTMPCFHVPSSRANTASRAATLPDGYQYGHNLSLDNLDTTISSQYSDHSAGATLGGTRHHQPSVAQFRPAGEVRATLRSSLPDMSKPAKIYPLEKLQTTNKDLPEDVDRQHLERHLSREVFEELFEMTPIEFYKLPEWKRINLKRKVKLF